MLRGLETDVDADVRPPDVPCRGCCRGELWLGLAWAVSVLSEEQNSSAGSRSPANTPPTELLPTAVSCNHLKTDRRDTMWVKVNEREEIPLSVLLGFFDHIAC